MTQRRRIHHVLHRLNPARRQRAKALSHFYDAMGLVDFGTVHQHADEYDAVRGFTASLSHQDTHYAVGNYNDYDIRVVDRFDTVSLPQKKLHPQTWTIIEINLKVRNMPHIFFVPTGQAGAAYSRLFTAQPYMQPLNSLFTSHRSPEFHGRYQILARTTHSRDVENLLTSPVIVGIGNRFWPHGIEIEHGRLYVYLTEATLTKQKLDTALASALWLANTITNRTEAA